MEVKLAVLADYANITREGKLNVMGIFSLLWAKRFPVSHPQMQLVMEFEAHAAEAGRKRKVEVQLRNADGRSVFQLGGEMEFIATSPGEPIRGQQIIVMNGVTFETPGSYEFAILIDNDVKKTVSLQVVQLPLSPPMQR